MPIKQRTLFYCMRKLQILIKENLTPNKDFVMQLRKSENNVILDHWSLFIATRGIISIRIWYIYPRLNIHADRGK